MPFDQITDQRNTAPTMREFSRPDPPEPYLTAGLDVDIPDVDDLEPTVWVDNFVGVQPYRLVIFAEKSSLDPLLTPIARAYQADLYLMTGEISDTLLYQMATTAVADGRPMIVLTLADSDPSGWQMPISISRKLQAFRSLGHRFNFQVRRIGLTPKHVRSYGLPSTPLKDTERRSDKWLAATGTEQTELDAMLTLQPKLLDQLTRAVLNPFYDKTLNAGRYSKRYSEEFQRRNGRDGIG